MQNIIKEYPTEARNLLIQNPQLTYAMLQSLVIMGLLSPKEATQMLHKKPDISSLNLLSNFPNSLPIPTANFPVAPTLLPQTTLPLVPPPPPPPFHALNFPLPTSTALPQTQTNNSPLSRTDQEKAQLLLQVLQLNDAQIAQLPADQRASIMLLREQMQQSGIVSL